MGEIEKVLREVRHTIRESGQCVMFIGDDGRSFSYTVGRSERGLPELLLAAPLEPKAARAILNHLDRLMPVALPSGSTVHMGGKFPVLLLDATDEETWEEYCCIAARFYGRPAVQQVVVCDKAGRFPPDCDARWQQPLLGAKP